MTNQNKTDIGLIGLAVMGENLALNMESKGWYVSVYNRTVPGVEEGVVDRFMIGKKGQMLKTIGTQARLELEKVLDKKVYLELNVKVTKNWRKKQKNLGDWV